MLRTRLSRSLAAGRSALALCLALVSLGACAGGAAPEPAPAPTRAPTAGAAGTTAAQPAPLWPVRTREHVDLWLHGFAMLVDDSSRVPIFRRGYREEMRTLRARANVTTQLDAERDRLRQRFALNRQLPLSAQFVALAFTSWDELRRAIQLFVQADGDPRRAADQRTAGMLAYLAQNFPAAADREWLRVFANALDDESNRFYHRHWLDAQRDRSAALLAADTLWQRTTRPALQRFLNNTQQRDGELLLSLPLGGEGRTVAGGGRSNQVAVGFPTRADDAAEASYVMAHEIVGTLAGSAVSDNTTPAEQRAGAAERYVSAAQVRGGHVLLQQAAPRLADGYARYYLRLVGASASGDLTAALAAAYPLPAAIADALARQIEVTLGGI